MRRSESRLATIGRNYAVLAVRTAGTMAGIAAFGMVFTASGAPDFSLLEQAPTLGMAALLALAAAGCFYAPASVLGMSGAASLGSAEAASGRDGAVDDESRGED